MKAFLLLFVLFNLITFFVFGYDKYLARTNRRRVSEKTLLSLAVFGGSAGAVFAQKIFRHKSKKYRYLFWIILTIQFILFEAIWFFPSDASHTLQNFSLT
ncbi:DUF1294 domain-containing protein [Sulfuricurvum sp.]|uniref:DUF1294 domain-containing protein n=1 Tax=Sulfuricurvum sp. TaxID=2025608 RepID=UPI002613F3B4|nr:DUF1294 domain-containing protein [Sulfuricurvum sp.]MDD4884073.1 DUF1294 domain-containing protein [Sulfuricurvum sp.]